MNDHAAIVQAALERQQSLVNGHFVLKAGQHSDIYINAGHVSEDMEELDVVAAIMARYYVRLAPEFFTCPADGAILLTGAVTREYNKIRAELAPKARCVFASKGDEPGAFVYKRDKGKSIAGKRGVVLDDLGSTGSSVLTVVDETRLQGGTVLGVGYLCIRGDVTKDSVGGVDDLYAPLYLPANAWVRDECPLCKQGIPINIDLGHGKAYVEQYGQPVAA